MTPRQNRTLGRAALDGTLVECPGRLKEARAIVRALMNEACVHYPCVGLHDRARLFLRLTTPKPARRKKA